MTEGTPCAVKAACTVWSGGKPGDNLKGLPITIATRPYEPRNYSYRGSGNEDDEGSRGQIQGKICSGTLHSHERRLRKVVSNC